jgi:hypothetical protein
MILQYMEIALEVRAFKSLQALLTIFAPSFRVSTDVTVKSRIQKFEELLSEEYLRAVFNETELPEQGPSHVSRSIGQFIDAAALEQETSYVTDGTLNSAVGRMRLFHAARDVVRAERALGEMAQSRCSLSNSDNEQLDKMIEDLSRWKDFERRHGSGAALDLEHPYNRNLMRLFRANPSLQDTRFEVAAQKRGAYKLECLNSNSSVG